MKQATQAPVLAPPPPGVSLGRDPAAIYRALQQRSEILRNQQENLQDQHRELRQQYDQMSSGNPGGAAIEKRMANIDTRVAEMDAEIAKSDQAVAQAAGIPGATVEPPRPPRDEVDMEMVVGLSFTFAIIVAIPVTIAYARRIWRRSARAEVTLPPQMAQRMESIEQGVEAIALEVERIGESQRFLTQAMAERVEVRAIGDAHGERKAERAEVRR